LIYDSFSYVSDVGTESSFELFVMTQTYVGMHHQQRVLEIYGGMEDVVIDLDLLGLDLHGPDPTTEKDMRSRTSTADGSL
jgi:hypothetical protein